MNSIGSLIDQMTVKQLGSFLDQVDSLGLPKSTVKNLKRKARVRLSQKRNKAVLITTPKKIEKAKKLGFLKVKKTRKRKVKK